MLLDHIGRILPGFRAVVDLSPTLVFKQRSSLHEKPATAA
jgi:hypothetical protein